MKRISEIPLKLHEEWIKEPNGVRLDEFIRSLGFKSCVYVDNGGWGRGGWWEMSEEDYTWFILRWA